MEQKQLDVNEFSEVIKDCTSIIDVSRKLGIPEFLSRSLVRLLGVKPGKPRNRVHSRKRYTEKEVRELYLSNKFAVCSSALRPLLLKVGLKEHVCELCKETTWMGYPIPLELHHINGNHYDNTESNLMLICPNCHTILTQKEQLDKKQAKEEARKKRAALPIEACIKYKKFNCTASELIEAFQKYKAYTKVASLFGVSDNAIKKRCKRLGIYEQIKPIIDQSKIDRAYKNRRCI